MTLGLREGIQIDNYDHSRMKTWEQADRTPEEDGFRLICTHQEIVMSDKS